MQYKIAFGYKARAGKDFAAEYLIDKLGGVVHKLASPVYELATYLQKYASFPVEKDRALLQFIGTDWGRTNDPDVWIRMFRDRHIADTGNCFVTDMRFVNEADALLAMGYILVRVDRTDLPEPAAEWRKHPSETALDGYRNWHYRVRNCGHAAHFHETLDVLVEYIRQRTHEQHNFRTLLIE